MYKFLENKKLKKNLLDKMLPEYRHHDEHPNRILQFCNPHFYSQHTIKSKFKK